jgi:hypothetical protein
MMPAAAAVKPAAVMASARVVVMTRWGHVMMVVLGNVLMTMMVAVVVMMSAVIVMGVRILIDVCGSPIVWKKSAAAAPPA